MIETLATALIAQEGAEASLVGLIINLLVILFLVASIWIVFSKAGEPGWAAIIPIYNGIVLLRIAGKPLWWIILFIIPLVNLIVAIVVSIALARAFGKGTGFGLGLAFLGIIFYPILAFGEAKYVGAPAD